MKNTLVIGVLALIVTASADTYYWNPTTTPGAAGEANWSRTAAAWSDSSSGTSSPVVWPTWSDAVFQTYDGLNTVNATEDIGADSLSILGGTYMFTGNKTIKVHSPGLRVVDSTVTVSNIISVTESNTTLAFTNSTFRYRGGNGSAFQTGSKFDNVSIEIVNTTDQAEGMYWDCMKYGIIVGNTASGCSFLLDGGAVTDGAVVTNIYSDGKSLQVGIGAGACNNAATIRGGAKFWGNLGVNNAGNAIGRGNGANGNRLEIQGGDGFVTTFRTAYPPTIGSGACTGNVAVVDGKCFASSAKWLCGNQNLVVGGGGGFANELRVLDGGRIEGAALKIGHKSCSNLVYVSGIDSVIRGGAGNTALTLGSGDSASAYAEGNRLVIENGGLVENFAKWNTAVGGHENNDVAGRSNGNGVEIRSGGRWSVPNYLWVGRTKGAGCCSSYNYIHVSGQNSALAVSYNQGVSIGVAYANSDVGAMSWGNKIVVEDGATATSMSVYLASGTTSTLPGAVSNNTLVVRRGGTYAVTDSGNGGWSEIATGLAGDSEEAPVAVGNKIIAEEGGILEARTFKTLSGNGNTMTFRNGGVLQTRVKEPNIMPFAPGAISMHDAVLSYHGTSCDVKLFESSTKETGYAALDVRGSTTFRLTDASTDRWNSGSQSYAFGKTDNPRHFVRLEMVDGTTVYQKNANLNDELTIASTGSMLCSNTTARVEMPLTLEGPLAVVNSSLTLTTASSLNAPVTLVDATLDLAEGTTVGAKFSLTIGGELESGRDVITSVSDLNLQATLPECWRLRKRATETGFAYYTEYRKPGLAVIVR